MAAAIRAGPGPRQSGGPRRRHPPPRRQGVRRAARRGGDPPRPIAAAGRPGAAAPVGAATMKLVPLTDGWSLAAVAAALVLGLLLALGGRGLRRRLGLGPGRTVALDNVTLTSRRYGLTGRIDRLVRE